MKKACFTELIHKNTTNTDKPAAGPAPVFVPDRHLHSRLQHHASRADASRPALRPSPLLHVDAAMIPDRVIVVTPTDTPDRAAREERDGSYDGGSAEWGERRAVAALEKPRTPNLRKRRVR